MGARCGSPSSSEVRNTCLHIGVNATDSKDDCTLRTGFCHLQMQLADGVQQPGLEGSAPVPTDTPSPAPLPESSAAALAGVGTSGGVSAPMQVLVGRVDWHKHT
jgi:hypothetical protein